MKGNSILKKTGLYFIGNLSSKLLVAILIPIYAFFVKPQELGYFDYTQTIMNIMIPIVFLSIWDAILKFLLGKKDCKKEQVVSSTMVWVVGVIAILTLIILLLKSLNILNIKYCGLVIVMMIVYALAQIYQYFARGFEKNSTYVLSSILGTTVYFLLVVVFIIVLKLGIKGLYWSYILGQIAIILVIEKRINMIKYINIKEFKITILLDMIKFSAPLVLNTISVWLISGYGKIIVNHRLGEVANGIYSFANKIPLIITTLGSIIAMAIIEEAILNSNNKDFKEKFAKTIYNVFRIFVSIIIVAIPLVFIVFEIFKNTQYYEAKNYMMALLVYAFAATMGTNVGSVFQAINKTKYQFITTFAGGIVCVIISYLFIGKFEIQAVVIAQAIGMLITLILRYLFAMKFVNLKINIKYIIMYSALFTLVSIISSINNIYMLIATFILSSIAAAVINRDMLKQLILVFNKFRKKGTEVKTYLVTGGAGFIGSSLTERLLNEGNKVVVIDNFCEFYDSRLKENNVKEFLYNDSFKLYRADIRDKDIIKKIFSENKIDIVVHLAAMAGVRPSIEDPVLYQEVNCMGTQNILEEMKANNTLKLVMASSSSVYGNCDKVPFREDMVVDFAISPYAATKKANEVMTHVYHKLFNLNVIMLRFFTVYGPKQRPDLAINKFTRLMLEDKEIPMFGDGTTSRDYTYIDDIVDGIIKSCEYVSNNDNVYEILNLGNSSPISLREMIDVIGQTIGVSPKIKQLPMQPGDVERTYADITKAKNLIGYNPKTTFEEGIKKFVEWYDQNIDLFK